MNKIYLLLGLPIILMLFISNIGFGQCDIEVTISSTGWGDGTTWELTDDNGNVVLSGGTYGNGYSDTQVHSPAANPPYTLTIVSTSFDNSPNYEVVMFGNVAFSGNVTANTTETVGPITCPAPPTCPQVNGVVSSLISTTEVDFSWNAGGTETEWNVEWGAPGFAPGTGTEIGSEVVTVTPDLTVTGLNPDTDYDFHIQAVCGVGDESFWVGPNSVFTGYCSPVYTSTTEWLEYFETSDALVENFVYSASAQPTNGLDNLTATDTLKQYEGLDIDFDYTYSYNGANTLKIWVDWNDDLVFDTATEEIFSQGATTPNQSGTMVIPPGTPTGVYTMRIRSTYGSTTTLTPCGTNTWGSTVDIMFEIVELPSCIQPTNISLIEATDSSLEFEWDDLGSATSYTVEWGEPGFTPGTGDEIGSLTSTTLDDIITGLDPTTSYDIYIQSDCGGGDISSWSIAATFTTICEVFPAPFEEDFDGSSWVPGTGGNNSDAEIDDCWTNIPSTSANFFWGTRTGTTTSGSTGPSGDVSGSGNYIVTEATNGSNGDTAVFDTPMIDLSMVNDPHLIFNYHMYGANIDSLVVQVSNDNGNSFVTLLSIEGQQQADNTDDWIDTTLSLVAYENDTIIVRFKNNKSGFNSDIGIDEISILSCIPDGGVDNEVDVCRLDEEINLNDQVTINQGGGKWSFPTNESAINNDIMLNITSLPAGAYEAYYIVPGACEDDTTTATLNIFPPSSAGENGTIIVCRNEPIDLFSGLSGNVDMGGTWYDPSDNPLPNSLPFSSNIPGSFNYDYVVSNGVCPADTQFVEVLVDECDWLSVEEEEMTKIEVYPNPASDILNINNGSNMDQMTIEMFDMNGRLVLSDNNSLNNADNATITIDHLEKGIYTLRVGNHEGQKTFKIVKH